MSRNTSHKEATCALCCLPNITVRKKSCEALTCVFPCGILTNVMDINAFVKVLFKIEIPRSHYFKTHLSRVENGTNDIRK
jgi:hypothetical protein